MCHTDKISKITIFFHLQEPIVYINGKPFAPRNPEDLHRNLDITFSVEELDNLEAHYANILKAKAAEKDGVLRTMKDVAFAENPMDREATGEDTKVSRWLIVICGIRFKYLYKVSYFAGGKH